MVTSFVSSVDVLERTTLSREEELRQIVEARSSPEAFAPIYERYYDRVYLYLLRRCGNPATAEDLTSDTFMKAMRAIPNFRFREVPLLAWLFRIAHNTFISHCRKEKIRTLFRVENKPEGTAAEYWDPAQCRKMDYEEAGKLIAKMIRRLKPHDQFIVTLRYYEEMSMRDVAAAVEMTEGCVRTRLHRALVRLRKLVEKEAPDVAQLIGEGGA